MESVYVYCPYCGNLIEVVSDNLLGSRAYPINYGISQQICNTQNLYQQSLSQMNVNLYAQNSIKQE